MRNPTWTREEMLLALDLYFQVDPLRVEASNSDVVALSRLLQTLPFHPAVSRADTFRNPTGIVMTLRTFMHYDPTRHHRGLRGGKMGRELWAEFADRRTELRELARAVVAAGKSLAVEPAGPIDDEGFEGGVLFRWHRLRERNRRLVERKKAQVKHEHGQLICEACGFDFGSAYGALGEGFVECHHCRPLGEMPSRGPVRLADLALICSNCHRMLHRKRPLITVETLRQIVGTRRQGATSGRLLSTQPSETGQGTTASPRPPPVR